MISLAIYDNEVISSNVYASNVNTVREEFDISDEDHLSFSEGIKNSIVSDKQVYESNLSNVNTFKIVYDDDILIIVKRIKKQVLYAAVPISLTTLIDEISKK